MIVVSKTVFKDISIPLVNPYFNSFPPATSLPQNVVDPISCERFCRNLLITKNSN